MCCSNKRACGGRRQRRAPVLVTLGALAYQKYQERKAERTSQDNNNGRLLERSASPVLGGNVPFNHYGAEIQQQYQQPAPAYGANANVSEKAGYEPQQQPPSYAFAVNGTPQQQPQQQRDRNIFSDDAEAGSDLSDAESFYDVVDGEKRDSKMVREASRSFIGKIKARRASGEKQFNV